MMGSGVYRIAHPVHSCVCHSRYAGMAYVNHPAFGYPLNPRLIMDLLRIYG